MGGTGRSGGSGWTAFLTPTLLAGILIGLLVLIFQIDNLEDRFIRQSKQLRALGEASDRVAARVERLAEEGLVVGGGTAARTGDPYARYAKGVKLLHPELPNLFEPDAYDVRHPDAPRDGVLLRGWNSGDPKSFNSILESDAVLTRLVEAYSGSGLGGRMVWTDPDRWTDDIAWRAEVSEDYREFTFYLKPGIRWHRVHGVDTSDPKYAWLDKDHEVTAHDFAFSLEVMLNPQVENGFLKVYFQDVESWEVVDDYTFVVRWKRSLYGNLGSTLAIPPLPRFLFAYDERGEPFPPETLGLRFNQHWYNNKGYVGSGPYELIEYEPGVRIVLERNEDYYGQKPNIQRIEYPIFTDQKREVLMLKSKEVTYGRLFESEYREEIVRWQDEPASKRPKNSPFWNGQLTCEKVDMPAYYYLGWNADLPIFADKRVRHAMTHALDRETMIEEIYMGLGELAVGPFLPSGPYLDPSIEPIPYDPKRAAELLAEAGWEDTDGDGLLDRDLSPDDPDPTRSPFEFSLLIYGGSPEWLTVANVFQQALLKLGVRMKIETAEWSLMQKRMDERDFEALTGGWGLSWETDPYQIWHSSQADAPNGSNKVGFRNARVDELIETLRETFDHDERTEMLREIHRIIHGEQAYTFFRVHQKVSCWQKELQNVVFAIPRPRENSAPWWVEAAP